jgi:tetratricopeptide (TPR) repeat protein
MKVCERAMSCYVTEARLLFFKRNCHFVPFISIPIVPAASMSGAEAELLSDDELPSLLAAIAEHDQQAAELQQESSRLPEALVILERALVLRTRAFGVQSEQVITACKSLAELCNLQAIGDLARGEFKSALELLKKAQILTDQHPLVRAVTFNNFACYYRRYADELFSVSYC